MPTNPTPDAATRLRERLKRAREQAPDLPPDPMIPEVPERPYPPAVPPSFYEPKERDE
jgi:hypothetical protein